MDNNDLMDGQYDPDFDTLSMLSDDSGYYQNYFKNFSRLYANFVTRKFLTEFIQKN